MRSISEGLVDLEELIIACRTEDAREYIREAVGCYKSGAYRSCIVATWIAVVYDIVDKLRDLALSGNKNAEQKIDRFESIHEQHDVEGSLRFEREILEIAKDEFELLTEIEYNDLERLQEDRHRCAHPSMMSLGEPYQPTAETARYHLHNAVHHLLQREPVQGKSALERTLGDVRSEYFPQTTERAVEFFKESPIANARDSLIRNVIVVIAKELLLGEAGGEGWKRRMASINAIGTIHPEYPDAALQGKLPGIASRVDDEQIHRVVAFVRDIPNSWQWLGSQQQRLENFISSVELEPHELTKDGPGELEQVHPAILHALNARELKAIVLERIESFSHDGLADVVEHTRDERVIEEVVGRFVRSKSYFESDTLGNKALLPVLDEVGAQHLQKLLSGFIENDQIHTCILAEPAVDSIFRRSINFCDELGPQLEEVYMFMRESEYDYDEWMRVIEEGCPDLDWVKDARRDEELPF